VQRGREWCSTNGRSRLVEGRTKERQPTPCVLNNSKDVLLWAVPLWVVLLWAYVVPCRARPAHMYMYNLGYCRRGNSLYGWRNAPALNPKMRKGLKCFACLAKRSPST
jgi:hypothetical protein